MGRSLPLPADTSGFMKNDGTPTPAFFTWLKSISSNLSSLNLSSGMTVQPSGDTSGATDVANINAAMAAANTAGINTVYLTKGIWNTNATIVLAYDNIALVGAGSTADNASNTAFHGSFNGPIFQVFRNADSVWGWGLRDVFIKQTVGGNTSSIGVQVGSSQQGCLSRVRVLVSGTNQQGIVLDASLGTGGVFSNDFESLSIFFGGGGTGGTALKLTGTSSVNSNNNRFMGVNIIPTDVSHTAIRLEACDTNIFVNTSIFSAGGVAAAAITQDYTITAGGWPESNMFFGYSASGSMTYPVVSAPGSPNINTIYGLALTNSAIPNAAGLYVTESIFTPVTVANLSASPQTGARAFVSNATQALTAGIGAVVAGGGANKVPVVYDGTNWRIG